MLISKIFFPFNNKKYQASIHFPQVRQDKIEHAQWEAPAGFEPRTFLLWAETQFSFLLKNLELMLYIPAMT